MDTKVQLNRRSALLGAGGTAAVLLGAKSLSSAKGAVTPGGDDTALVQAAINAGQRLGPGLYVCGPLTIDSNQALRGAGVGSTIIQLKAGANVDLLVTAGFAGLTGGATSA